MTKGQDVGPFNPKDDAAYRKEVCAFLLRVIDALNEQPESWHEDLSRLHKKFAQTPREACHHHAHPSECRAEPVLVRFDTDSILEYNKETKKPLNVDKNKCMGRKKLLTHEQVLTAIRNRLVQHGTPPTLDELRQELGVASKRTVQRYLDALVESGDIERWPGARGLRLRRKPPTATDTSPVPVVGEVAAGALTFADENIDAWLRLPTNFLQPESRKFFLLRVRGDSMNQATVDDQLIEDGDLLLVRQQAVAEAGDVVVALVDNEATVKRLAKGSGYWVLKPESNNPSHSPIMLESGFTIQGVATRVIKSGSSFV